MNEELKKELNDEFAKVFEDKEDETVMEFMTLGIKVNGNISCDVDGVLAQYVELSEILTVADERSLVSIITRINDALYHAIHKEDIE